VPPMERARIEAAGGTVDIGRVDGKLALSRAFGDPDWKVRPDFLALLVAYFSD